MVIFFGFYPVPIFDLMNKSLHSLMDIVRVTTPIGS
jgi:NADH:ubiquinone oxidoreductase subunit 4 (subunit M)